VWRDLWRPAVHDSIIAQLRGSELFDVAGLHDRDLAIFFFYT
jgi:hypothetical protein